MNNLKPCLGTCSWEPCWQPIAWNLPREFVLGTRTCSWEPVLRTLACEPVLAKLACKPVLGEPCLGTCSCKPCLGTCSQGPCRYPARKPVLGTLAWELEALFLEPLLVNLFLRTLLGNLGNVGNLGNLGKPGNLGNLGGMGFGAAPVCSETFTMAEDPKASAVGEKHGFRRQKGEFRGLPLKSWLWGQMGFMNGLGLGYPKSGATPSTWGTHTWGELVRTTIFILGPGMGYQATRPTRSLGDAWYRCWDYQSRWDCTPSFFGIHPTNSLCGSWSYSCRMDIPLLKPVSFEAMKSSIKPSRVGEWSPKKSLSNEHLSH